MKTILVPTDFSSNAKNALKYANALAKSLKAKIVLCNVYTPSVGKFNMISGIIAEEISSAKVDALKKLNKLNDECTKASCSQVVAVGDTVNGILDTAKEKKASFIVMGTHGASGLNKVLFGSNASNVISKSEIPVLTIPQRYKYKKIEKIIYASDLNNITAELKILQPFAKSLNANIEVLYLDYGWDKGFSKSQPFEVAMKKNKYKNVTFVIKKVSMEKAMVVHLKAYTNKKANAILVMFTQDKAWFDKFLIGSKTEDLAFNLKMPLLAVRKPIIKK